MPPRKKKSVTRRPSKASKTKPQRRSKTQALVMSEPIKRAPVGRVRLVKPLAVIEPLQRSIMDRQMALLGAAMAWSPAHIIIHQQAAFWDGFAGSSARVSAQRKPTRKRSQKKRANAR